jgi:hypothetical protein
MSHRGGLFQQRCRLVACQDVLIRLRKVEIELTHSSTEEGEEERGIAGDLRGDLKFYLKSVFVRRIIISSVVQGARKGGTDQVDQ